MIILDSHVHIYRGFSHPKILKHVRKNVLSDTRDPAAVILALAESAGVDAFAQIMKEAPEGFKLTACDDPRMAMVSSPIEPPIYLLRGYQVITAERIEVLALGASARIEDGLSLPATVNSAAQIALAVVLPWSPGKWIGQRGVLVSGYLRNAAAEKIYIGDIALRPRSWPTPAPMLVARSRGIRTLAGSDPLPMHGEESFVGRLNSGFNAEWDASRPFASLERALSSEPKTIGRRCSVFEAAVRYLKFMLRR